RAIAVNNLAVVLRDRGQRAEAEKAFRRAAELHEELVREFDDPPRYRQEAALSWTNLGNLLRNQNRFAEAEKVYLQALPHREKLATQSPTAPGYQWELAETRLKLGHTFRLQNQPAQALPWLDRAVAGLPPPYRNAPDGDFNGEMLRNIHY